MKISLGRAAFAAVACLSLAIAFPVFSQDLDDVTISGRITDPNGQSIVGATVTATQAETGLVRSVTTNEDGRYRLIELPPGTYNIKAEAAGFGTKERIDLVTVSGQNVQLDLDLAVGGVSAEVVTVGEDDAPAVDTTRTVVGGTITAREIEELPNASRNALDLVLTLGGTSEEQLSVNGLAEDRNDNPRTPQLEQGNFSLSGGTAYSNNITIDGLDNNDDRSSQERFQPSLESIVEVQVIANQFSAEYGRASGGRINLRTRAGSNRLRGRVFMFFRDDYLNANSWYNNSRGFSRLPLTEYNPGFTLGGPVILPFYNGTKRTFFSIAYEYGDVLDTTFINTWVPEGSNTRYTLPAGNAQCPTTTPSCTDTLSNPPTSIVPYQVLFSTPNVSHTFTARVDHKLTSKNDFTIGYQLGRIKNRRTRGDTTTRLDDALQARNRDADAINFTDNHVFSSKLINQFRMQYSIYEPSFETDNPFDPVILISYRNPETGGSQTLTAGNSTAAITGDATAFPQNRRETRYQFQDSATYLAGDHTFKFGFDIQNVRSKALGLGDATGTFNFANILNYQNNLLSRFRQNFGLQADAVNTYYGVFLNDQIQLAGKLTLSYGIRYEKETAVSDNNNFGPRLGIAWNPFKTSKGVIRFGAGIFYNRVLLRTVADSIQNTGDGLISFDTSTIGTGAGDTRRLAILGSLQNSFPSTFATVDDLRNLVASACSTVVSPIAPCTAETGFRTNVTTLGTRLRSVEDNIKIPESYQFNIGFEREIGKDFVFEANYTWNKTVHLWRDTNSNAPRLPAGFADWTEYLLDNPFHLSPNRSYTFFPGDPSDIRGLHANSQTGTTCTTTTVNCFVNLNSSNGSGTTPLVAVPGQNFNATGAPIGIAIAAIAQFRPDQTVEETSRIGSNGNAFYQGLILEMRRRYRPLGYGFGMSLRTVYTFSSTRDDGLNNTANAEINGDFRREWARNLQDRRHRVAITGLFDSPAWFGKVRFSPLFRYGSAGRFNLGIGGSDRNLDDLGTDRVNFSGDLNDIVYREPGTPFPAALAAQFSLQPIGSKSGNLPRNAGTAPSFYTFDLNITREWKFGERMRLRPIIEFNNILNAAVFSYGAEFIDFSDLYVADSVPNPTQTQINTQAAARERFLVPTRTYRQRQIRLGVRFDF